MSDTRDTKDGVTLGGQTSRTPNEIGTPDKIKGDQGGTSLLSDPHRNKGDLVMIRRAIRLKWPVKPEHQALLVDRMMELVAEPDPKVAVSALRAGVAMVDANIRVDMEEDKCDRLDAGAITERVETPIKFIRGTDGSGV